MKRLLPVFLLVPFLLGEVTYDRLLKPDREPQNWLTYCNSSGGRKRLDEKTLKNVEVRPGGLLKNLAM